MAVDLLRLRLEDLPAAPDGVLAEWLPPNDDPARPLMTLSTIAEDGAPDSRHLLLSEWGPEGFWLHTHAESRKVAQLAAHPEVSLALVWTELARQLVIRGRAEPASAEEASRAYQARSRYLKQLAWLNTPEYAARDYAERVEAWRVFAAQHPEAFPEPETWAGYLVRPTRITFWVGTPDAASRRIEYERAGENEPWAVSVLAG